jgi:hypothetical protein
MNTEINKTRKIIGWVISSLLMILFLFSAILKFMKPEQLNGVGLTDWRIIIALGEIISGLLYFFPKTNLLGTLLLSSYFGGAIILHMTNGLSIMMPMVVLISVWVCSFIRNPELIAKLK